MNGEGGKETFSFKTVSRSYFELLIKFSPVFPEKHLQMMEV